MDQDMDLTIGSLNFRVGSLGLIRLSDPAKPGPSASESKTVAMSESSEGSSTEVNSPVSFAATEIVEGKIAEGDETMENFDLEICQWISCRKNTGYHAMDPMIRMQGAERGRSWIATKHGDGSLESSNAQRTAERDAELYPGSGPSW
jgi:hypothetical protein